MTTERITGAVPDADVRGELVRDMFSRIAPTYVLTNRVMTFGIDALWRRAAIGALEGGAKGRVLDLCAGTLDLTLDVLAAGAEGVVAADFAQPMLDEGEKRLPAGAPVELVCADAQDLPFDDDAFDAATCGFGLRNVPDNAKALGELRRVLRPGGRIAVLELFRPTSAFSRAFHAVFDRVVLPLVGGLISGDRGAYTYLANSMSAYLSRDEFVALAQQQGFRVVVDRWLFPVCGLVVLETP